jgi:uncharacterized protein (TIGR00369 family)
MAFRFQGYCTLRSAHVTFSSTSFNNNTKFRVTAASPGKVHFELPIQKQHTNRLGILHGGTIASMVDLSGSLALASRGLFSTGVSTDLNVTYLNSGGKIGDVIRGEVVCDKCT